MGAGTRAGGTRLLISQLTSLWLFIEHLWSTCSALWHVPGCQTDTIPTPQSSCSSGEKGSKRVSK